MNAGQDLPGDRLSPGLVISADSSGASALTAASQRARHACLPWRPLDPSDQRAGGTADPARAWPPDTLANPGFSYTQPTACWPRRHRFEATATSGRSQNDACALRCGAEHGLVGTEIGTEITLRQDAHTPDRLVRLIHFSLAEPLSCPVLENRRPSCLPSHQN